MLLLWSNLSVAHMTDKNIFLCVKCDRKKKYNHSYTHTPNIICGERFISSWCMLFFFSKLLLVFSFSTTFCAVIHNWLTVLFFFFCIMIGCRCYDCHCHKLDFHRVVSCFVYLNRNQFSKLSRFFLSVATKWFFFLLNELSNIGIEHGVCNCCLLRALIALLLRDNW